MAYNPQNMYRPGVLPDTQGMGPGIEAAGKAVSGAITDYASNRSATKAADAEFDLFQQLYPEAAGMIDAEKFHAANLAGKQKMLGMGKGYVLEQTQKDQFNQEMTLKQLESAQRAGISASQLELSAKELGLRATHHADEMGMRDRQFQETAVYNASRMRMDRDRMDQEAAISGARLQMEGQELGLRAQESAMRNAMKNRGPAWETMRAPDGSETIVPMLPSDNQVSGMGPMRVLRDANGKVTKLEPIPGLQGTKHERPVFVDDKPYRTGEDGNLYPVTVIEGQTGPAAPPPKTVQSFYSPKK